MSTITILLLCTAAGSVLHIYQIVTLLAWLARGPAVGAASGAGALSVPVAPLPFVVALEAQDSSIAAEPPPDAVQPECDKVNTLAV